MNARQKAKKYKRLYEALASSPFKPTVVYSNRDIIPVVSQQVLSRERIDFLPRDFIERSVKKALAEELLNYMDIEYEDMGDYTSIRTRINIVR